MTSEGGVEPDWQRTALEYAKRIHVLECTAVADQESYRRLQVENENLKLRLEMAESNNPDSVLSKHNAMLMACKSRDGLAAKVERAVEILGALHLMKSHDAGPVYDAARVDEALEALR